MAWGLIVSFLEVMPFGHLHAQQVARTQPEKFAAIEGLYTQPSPALRLSCSACPSRQPAAVKGTIEIPGLLSWMAFGDTGAHVQGLDQFPVENRPPLWLTFVSFHNMVLLGIWFIALMAWSAWQLYRGRLFEDRRILRALDAVHPAARRRLPARLGGRRGRPPALDRLPAAAHRPGATRTTVTAAEIGFSLGLFGLVYLGLFVRSGSSSWSRRPAVAARPSAA